MNGEHGSYLAYSKYGIYNEDIAVNEYNANSGGTSQTKEEGNNLASVYSITGYNDTKKKWNEYLGNDKSPSTTGNIYGIYDMSGGNWESGTGYIANNHENLTKFGETFTSGVSTKYAIVYPGDDNGADDTEKSTNNYQLNKYIYGMQ